MKSVSHRSTRRTSLRTPALLSAINAAFGWHQHPRSGKVARLPETTRNLINRMLQDGRTYRNIIDSVQRTVPYALSEMNLSNWYHGGYQDWRMNERIAAFPMNSRANPSSTPSTSAMNPETTRAAPHHI